MKYKAGDVVRIQPKEWIDAQEKDAAGGIMKTKIVVFSGMFQYAGRTAKITAVLSDGIYRLVDMDNGEWQWPEWMFDPDYDPTGEPLPFKHAVRALLNGKTLYDADGWVCMCDKGSGEFFAVNQTGKRIILSNFGLLYRKNPKAPPEPRKRTMTVEEVKAWTESDASFGWMVSYHKMLWSLPRYFTYSSDIAGYRRARILPDMSGIDESTIQGFEVEEE